MDLTNNTVFICSPKRPFALAMERTLSLLAEITPYIVPSIEADVIAEAANSCSDEDRGDATFLVYYESVSLDTVPLCINTVVNLRTRSYNWNEYGSRWIGSYVAVVPNESLARRIETADLFGRQERSNTAFSKIRANKCLFQNPPISHILKVVAESYHLGWREWDRICQREWNEGPLINLQKEGHKLLDSGDEKVYDVCREIQKLCVKIDWQTFFLHDDKNKLVRALLEAPHSTTIEQSQEFLETLDKMLAKVFKARGLTEL